MGIHIIKMPDIGEGIAEVELVAWHVKVGDVVAEDQILADVMTDKATVEIPSSVAGKVLALGGVVGQVMAVGSEVIRIEVAGAGNVKDGGAAQAVAPTTPAAPAAPAASAPTAAPTQARPDAPAPVAAPAQAPTATAAPARREGANGATVAHVRQPGDKPIASPALRRQAWELGIELQFVPGSGPAGRIVQADLDAYAARAAQGTAATGSADQRYAQRNDEQAVPVIGLRRKIAQKMQESKRRIPHFAYVEEIDVTELEALRAKLNAKYG